ncbi:MAG: response regulator [Williamsia sp.]|nr:response regulator [Williamsia sp.]
MENNKLTFYVVEDSALFQHMIGRLLQPINAQALYFTSGEEAINKLPLHPPDLVILDYNLDGNMNGLDTLQVIRRHYPVVYVILFSTRAEINTAENIQRYGEFDFVEKNKTGFGVLQQKINQAVSQFEPGA